MPCVTELASWRTPSHPVSARTAWEAFAVDALVAVIAIGSAACARIGIEQIVGGVAPFVLTFPAVMLATLVSGARAGTIAAVGCQLLTIRYVFPNWVSTHGGVSVDLANVVLSTVALAGTVGATASYRTTSSLLRSRCEDRVLTLSLLMSEIDHRTKNNFQIAAGLLAHQSISIADPGLTHELDKAALRLETIAAVYQDLSLSDATRQRLSLAEHVGRVVNLLRMGAVPDHITLDYRAEQVEVPVETGIVIAIIVNEWVTNALKHAFKSRTGRIVVSIARGADAIEVIVEDDGEPNHHSQALSRGSELTSALADVIGASLSIERGSGTRCFLHVWNAAETVAAA